MHHNIKESDFLVFSFFSRAFEWLSQLSTIRPLIVRQLKHFSIIIIRDIGRMIKILFKKKSDIFSHEPSNDNKVRLEGGG